MIISTKNVITSLAITFSVPIISQARASQSGCDRLNQNSHKVELSDKDALELLKQLVSSGKIILNPETGIVEIRKDIFDLFENEGRIASDFAEKASDCDIGGF